MPNLLERMINRFLSSGKNYDGGLFASQTNWLARGLSIDTRSITYTDEGVAVAYAVIPAVQASVTEWQSWLTGLTWQLVDTETGEIIYTSTDYQSPAYNRGTPFVRAIQFYESYSGKSFFSQVAFSDWMYGESFIRLLYNGYGLPSGLQWLNPLYLDVDTSGGIIHQYIFTANSDTMVLSAEDVIRRIHRNDPTDDLRGASPVLSALNELNIDRDSKRSVRAFFRNGQQMGGIMSPSGEDRWGRRDIEALTEMMNRSHRGVENSYNAKIFGRPITYNQFEPPDIAKNYSIVKEVRTSIMMSLDMPPEIAGDPSGANYANADKIQRNWWSQDAVPYANGVSRWVTTQVLPRFVNCDGLRFQFVTSQYELSEPAEIVSDFEKGIIDLATAQTARGYEPDEDLHNIYIIGGVPYSKTRLIEVANNGEEGPAETFNRPNAPKGSYRLARGILSDNNLKDSPPNTTFSTVTYNGITVQASPVRPSSKNDKKYMRYVRYQGDERLIHWGQPGEQMERDNPESRENFNSRHSCKDKRDPFSAGFWACWHWQPSAKNAPDLSDIKLEGHTEEGHEHSHDLLKAEIWDYDTNKAWSEAVNWQRAYRNNKMNFIPQYLRGDFADAVTLAIQTGEGVETAFDDVFKHLRDSGLKSLEEDFLRLISIALSDDIETTLKTLDAVRIDFEDRFSDVLQEIRAGGIDNRRRAGNIIRQIIRVFGFKAYVQGMRDGGVLDMPNDDDEEVIAKLRQEQSQYVSGLTNVLIKEDGISDAQANLKAQQWFNKSIMPFYRAGLLSANRNGSFEWVYGDTIHCKDCNRLNGQVHRLRDWHRKGLLPQSGDLECNGYNCQCRLVPTMARARGRF